MHGLLFTLLVGLAQVGADLIRSSKDAQIPPIYPIGTVAKDESVPKAVGRLFEINGQVTYLAGTNAWWLGHLSKNEDIDKSMKQMSDTKYKIVRVWGFGDRTTIPAKDAIDPNRVWYQLLNQSGGYINYGEDGLQRLDYVVYMAEKLGLKLILPFVNNWQDFGGFPAYAQTYGSNMTFFENPRSQEVYRDYIKFLVTRYRNSSAIFSWQLCNEPQCAGCSVGVIYKWATEISQYIKSLDPHHMVSLGDIGSFVSSPDYLDDDGKPYQVSTGVDFVGNLNISTLDYGTFHLYPSWWGKKFEWGSHWISQHADVGTKLNKPVVLEEYGSNQDDHAAAELPWQDTVMKTGIAADQIWQFGPTNLSMDAKVLGDEFSVYVDMPEFEKLGKLHAQAMLDKKV